MEKKFQRNEENFVCEKCGINVSGDGYTNHCPCCLWSKHVDKNPGDRLEVCKGMMEPISVEKKGNEWILTQKCERCGFKRKNKTSKYDNMEKVIEVSTN